MTAALADVPTLGWVVVGDRIMQRLDDDRWRVLGDVVELSTDEVSALAVDGFETLLLAGPVPPVNPDCAAGKHRACRGDAWDLVADAPARCSCSCHGEEVEP